MGLLAAWFPGGSPLTLGDWAVAAAVTAGMFWVARRAAGERPTAKDWLLAGRSVPSWAAAASFAATEFSAMTILGVPVVAFREDWSSLQFFAGSVAARVLVAAVFAPLFHASEAPTVYGWLGSRFGPLTRRAAAALFFLTRLLASSVRLMVAGAAVGALSGLGAVPAVLALALAGALYVRRGGLKAVVWTNVYQLAVVAGAGLLTVAFLVHRIDGGLGGALGLAQRADKLDLGGAGFLAFLAALVNGFFGAAGSFATDQEMAQKLITTRSPAEARRAGLLSIALSGASLLLFLFVGTLLWVFYKQNPGLALPEPLDRLYPHFAGAAMPRFVRGAVLMAVVMAAVDSPLASLSSAFVADVWSPRAAPSEEETLATARRASDVSAAALALLACWLAGHEGALWLAFKVGGATYGALLGVFALGVWSPRRGDRSGAAALVVTALVCGLLLPLCESGVLPFGWSWLVPFGAALSAGLGYSLAPVIDGTPPRAR